MYVVRPEKESIVTMRSQTPMLLVKILSFRIEYLFQIIIKIATILFDLIFSVPFVAYEVEVPVSSSRRRNLSIGKNKAL